MKWFVPIFVLILLATPVSSQLVVSEFATIRIDQVRYDPFPAEAGRYVDVFIKVENTDLAEAENLECELIPEFPFSLDPNEEAVRSVGRLRGFEDVLFEYKVRVSPNAVEGDNDMGFRCSTVGLGQGLQVTRTLTINVESNQPEFAVGLITSVPEELKADQEDVKLTVMLQNIGGGDAKFVTVELNLPEGFEASDSFSDSYSLGTVEKDSSEEAVFYLDIAEGVRAGSYAADLIVQYKDDNNNQNEFKTQILRLSLNVKASPMFVIEEVRAGAGTASDGFTGYVLQDGEVVSPSTLEQGGVGELRIRVRNSGEEEAERVSVKVFQDSQNIPIDFDEVFDFIGNLDAGEAGEAVFTFSIDADAVLKEYLLETEIRYIDGNVVETETYTVPLAITRQGADNSLLVIAVVIIIIIAGLGIWKKKKR